MDMMVMGMVIGFFVGLVLLGAVFMARAGSVPKAWWGLTVAGQTRFDPSLEGKIQALLGQPVTAAPTPAPTPTTPSVPVSPKAPPAPPKPTGDALRLLALLQAEARLVDFLFEDFKSVSDAQVGQGVRTVHEMAQKVLKQYLVIEPVLSGTEGDRVTVPAGFDPSAIVLTGNVTGKPPFSGELLHPGWKVKELKLPTPATGQDLFVLQPAEVQL